MISFLAANRATGLSWLDSQIDPTDRPDPLGGGVVAVDSGDLGGELAAVDYSDTGLRLQAVSHGPSVRVKSRPNGKPVCHRRRGVSAAADPCSWCGGVGTSKRDADGSGRHSGAEEAGG